MATLSVSLLLIGLPTFSKRHDAYPHPDFWAWLNPRQMFREAPEPSTASIRDEGHPHLLLTSEAAGPSPP